MTPLLTYLIESFSVKFYTEEGNYDMVGNNTPVFFIRDTMKFPDFIHTQKRKYVLHHYQPTSEISRPMLALFVFF